MSPPSPPQQQHTEHRYIDISVDIYRYIYVDISVDTPRDGSIYGNYFGLWPGPGLWTLIDPVLCVWSSLARPMVQCPLMMLPPLLRNNWTPGEQSWAGHGQNCICLFDLLCSCVQCVPCSWCPWGSGVALVMETETTGTGDQSRPFVTTRPETRQRNLNNSGDYKMSGFMGNSPGQLEIQEGNILIKCPLTESRNHIRHSQGFSGNKDVSTNVEI